MKLDRDAAEAAIARDLAVPLGVSVPEAAMGMRRIAASTMMRAIRAVSVERGRDVRAATLMAFGGNGALFAAAMAEDLGISRILVPPMPGLFSAFGLLLAETEHHITRAWRRSVSPALAAEFQTILNTLLADGHELLEADGFPAVRRKIRLQAMARYVGQSSEIQVPFASSDAAAPASHGPAPAARSSRTTTAAAPATPPDAHAGGLVYAEHRTNLPPGWYVPVAYNH